MLRNNIKHKLTTILLSIAVAISGWLLPAQTVYAAVTVTISGSYLYVPKTACPTLYKVYTAAATTDYSGYGWGYLPYPDWYQVFELSNPGTNPSYDTGMRGFEMYDSCFIVINGSPVIDGNYLRYNIRGRLQMESSYPYWYYKTLYTSGYPSSATTYSGSHSLVSNTTATCTAAATQKCSSCGAVVPSGNALGHSWGDWITTKEATPYEAGSKKHVCTRNTSHVETEIIPQKHFNVYSGNSRINKIYIGSTLVMDANAGINTLVK